MQADSTLTDGVPAQADKPPRSFYVISALALVWYAIGVTAFVTQITSSPSELGKTPEQIGFYADVPNWVLTAMAVSTFGGVLACFMLLIRNKQAIPLFAVSLVAVLVQDVYNFLMADALSVFGAQMLVLPVLVLGIGVAMLVYAVRALRRGWL
ncbi:MAG: hypothetical protein AAFS02_05830 [Pseudomonadota bacterium]